MAHLYFGKKSPIILAAIATHALIAPFHPIPRQQRSAFLIRHLDAGVSGNGFGDFRESAYTIRQSDGSRVSHFVFSDYQIQQGKPALAGLPQTHGANDGIETLILSLKDDVAGLELQLFYDF